MDKNMIAYCGTYCGICDWRESTGCNGCKANAGKMFWGECDKAKCCISKGLEHCGQCENLPCEMLRDLFNDPDHGDGGARLRNLQNWKNGTFSYEKLRDTVQKNEVKDK